MSTLAGYIATICVTAVSTLLAQYLRPKIKIRYWVSHRWIYTIPRGPEPSQPAPNAVLIAGQAPPAAPNNALLLTQSVGVQNFGREHADFIEITHARKPDFFQLNPPRNFTETTTDTGAHTIRIESLAPQEWVTMQFLCYSHAPELSSIRSNAGPAKAMPVWTVRLYPKSVYAMVLGLMVTGGAFIAYWGIRLGMLLFKLAKA